MEELSMDTVCEACGKAYGKHVGVKCPTYDERVFSILQQEKKSTPKETLKRD